MKPSVRNNKGLTLIELVTVVAIIGIVSAIGWSMFERQSMKNRRTEAISAATRIANELQDYHSDNFSYASYTISATITNQLKWYTAAVSNLSQTTYTITLSPKAGGIQAGDSDCGNFSLNELGVKSISGSTSTAHCWGSN